MAWFGIFSGAFGGLVLAVLAYAAGWPLWLAALLYPLAGAALTGLVLLVLWKMRGEHPFAGHGTGRDQDGPADSRLAGSSLR